MNDNIVNVEETKIWETFNRDQIEQIIQGNIRSVDEKMGQMMELFITSGYYLRRQYNEKMYLEAGYDRFEDYVKERYSKSRSWATRMMQINEQYSIGGDDPRIDPKYKLYGISQLQEMLYLTDEQREQASPDMTVKEIRALKTPAPVEEEQLPGQMNVEDYPEMMPESAENVIKPAESVIESAEKVSEATENALEPEEKENSEKPDYMEPEEKTEQTPAAEEQETKAEKIPTLMAPETPVAPAQQFLENQEETAISKEENEPPKTAVITTRWEMMKGLNIEQAAAELSLALDEARRRGRMPSRVFWLEWLEEEMEG